MDLVSMLHLTKFAAERFMHTPATWKAPVRSRGKIFRLSRAMTKLP
jgi:hypothetical protein